MTKETFNGLHTKTHQHTHMHQCSSHRCVEPLKLLIFANIQYVPCNYTWNLKIVARQSHRLQLSSHLVPGTVTRVACHCSPVKPPGWPVACKGLRSLTILLSLQLGRIYLDMLNVYKVMSENISAAIALNGEGVTKQPLIKSMRVVKKETLKLISGWVSRSDDHVLVLDNFIPPLLEAVLMDYQVGDPSLQTYT